MKTTKIAALLFGVLLASFSQSFGQTNLQFTGVNATDESAIQLYWTSQSNHLYEIDEADALIDTNTGSTTWNLLYNNYPSQGTNTFIGDFGNYNLSPQILHPKNSPMRFYRVVDIGTDTTSDEPSVVVTSPTNNVAVSDELTVTVAATTDQPVLNGTKLYVDGQEMRPAALTTNYTDGTGVTNYEVDTYYLNTCEWGNKTHTLFATAECESGNGDAVNSAPVAIGHGVSPFVSVLFSNLITRISFSQPSFDPSSGQTQQVNAVFAANCDWTLNVADINSNIVFSTTGSGSSMNYNWNGTGNGGTNLPTGIYYYYINAETNGESDEVVTGGGSGGGGSPPSPDFAMSSFANTSELWALSSDGDDAVPLMLYPPGFNTNSLSIFSATPAQVNAARASVSSASFSSADSGGSFSPDASGGGSSASSQNSPASPQRQPANPIVGISGLYGVAWDTYTANGTNAMSAPTIQDIPGISGSYISLDGYPGSSHLTYAPLPQFNNEVGNFETEMTTFGWKHNIVKVDNQLSINDLTGSGTPFNNVSMGVLLTHGAYGNTQDYMAGLVKQMYFPITSGGSIQYLRMGLQCGTLSILDRKSDKFSASEAVGLPRHLSKEEYLQHYRPLIDDVIRTGQAVVVPDVSAEPSLKRKSADGKSEKMALICVPVKFGEEVVGCLSAERPSRTEVSLAADRRLLSLVANVIAQSVHFHHVTEERLNELQRENERLQEQLRTSLRPPNMIGNSTAMRSVYQHIEQVAGSATTVLIRGESGVGKELVARALHEQSPRKGKAFVKFNCAALPESIIESELFGHEKGAFTSAVSMRKGRFEIADGGTIFLDEIGDISPSTQIKLLRVLQEKEFERIERPDADSFRRPCHHGHRRNLEEMIEKEKFRSDLYYRLNVFPIYVPPLRNRKSDILLLTEQLCGKVQQESGKKFPAHFPTAAIDVLVSSHSARQRAQTRKCVERAVLLSAGLSIEAHHFRRHCRKRPCKKGPRHADSAVSALEYG